MFGKFGEFDSAEEINRAAAAQLKEGDLDAIKTIAEENGLDSEDAEDFLHRCNRFSDYSTTGRNGKAGNGIERFRTQKHDGRLEKLPDSDV